MKDGMDMAQMLTLEKGFEQKFDDDGNPVNRLQHLFINEFPMHCTGFGKLRMKIGLSRYEWYADGTHAERYKNIVRLTAHLENETELVERYLTDETAFNALIAALRLQGA